MLVIFYLLDDTTLVSIVWICVSDLYTYSIGSLFQKHFLSTATDGNCFPVSGIGDSLAHCLHYVSVDILYLSKKFLVF